MQIELASLPDGLGLPWSGAWAYPALAIVALYAVYVAALLSGRHSALLPGLRYLRDRPLHVHLSLVATLVAAVPGLLLAVYLVESAAAGHELRARARLSAAVDASARSLERRIGAYQRGLVELAGNVARLSVRDVATLEAMLDAHLDKDFDYFAMLAIDVHGRVIAARANPRWLGTRALPPAPPVTDRDYFKVPMRTGKPYLSDAFRGRGYGTDVLVALSAPVLRDGVPIMVVEGSYDLSTLDRVRGVVPMEAEAQILVLDRTETVIYASEGWQLAQLSAARELGRFVTADGAAVHVEDPAGATAGHLIAGRSNALGWKLLIRVPLTAIEAQVRSQSRGILIALIGWIVLSIALGWLLARRLAAPVMDLAAAFAGFDPAQSQARLPRPPPLAPYELRLLHVGAERTRRRLRTSYGELHGALHKEAGLRRELDATLEARDAVIAERTRELAARSVALERANRLLEAQARSDPLTGIANQRAFTEHLALAWRSTQRMGYPLSLLMIDVDHFKAYNDAHGHPKGDVCLTAVAQALQGVARRSLDFVARYGGEEFVLVLSATGAAGARQVAEDVRRAVRALVLPHPRGVGGIVTVSVGVATVDAPTPYADAEALLSAADEALYQAKRGGRDCVMAANGSGSAADSDR